ncbi:hypothetical protein HPB52_008704 [Rhipicephalus sanguineus]|uniref:Uncharacterized protein n=1 Tax=Rhipicephalus sanguineus TaxID=34632 RepID=A0A9D4PWC7_RHISA|nr:hypothetical protein HPB52_008704 [Rhipicephalus sanguineus]
MIGSPLGARERSPDPQRLEPGELTPVHQRSSRRLRGDPPEFGPLPTAPPTQAAFTVNSRAMASPVASSELIVSPPQGSNSEALRELVQSIIKEELLKLLQPQVTPTVSTLATVIRDEVRHALLQPEPEAQPIRLEQPLQERRVPTYADALRQPAVHNASFAAPRRCVCRKDCFQ